MTRRKTNHAANTGLAFRDQNTVLMLFRRRFQAQRRKVVGEHEGPGVRGITRAAGALIARTQVAIRIILRESLRLRFFNSSLPRTVGPLR